MTVELRHASWNAYSRVVFRAGGRMFVLPGSASAYARLRELHDERVAHEAAH